MQDPTVSQVIFFYIAKNDKSPVRNFPKAPFNLEKQGRNLRKSHRGARTDRQSVKITEYTDYNDNFFWYM